MKTYNLQISSIIIIAVIILLGSVFSTNSVAQISKSDGLKNDRISNASSPFEDLTEYALAKNKEGVTKTINSCKNELRNVKDLLSSETYNKIETLLAELEMSDLMKQASIIALKAVEGYHLLILSIDAKTSSVPVQVSLLDYVGFKSTVLLSVKNINWQDVLNTANEGDKLWAEISNSVKENALNDAVNIAIKGMKEAATEKNVGKANLAVQMDLALVDLLENYFEIRK